MKKTTFRSCMTFICLMPVFLGIIFFIYMVVLVSKKSHILLLPALDPFFYTNMTKNFGDFISGTVGILFTFTATLFLFVTMAEQRQQMYEARQDNDKSRYESTYFNILAMLDSVIKSVDANLKESTSNQIDSINTYYRLIKDKYETRKIRQSEMLDIIQKMSSVDNNPCEFQVTKLKDATTRIFVQTVKELNCNVDYFYRYIYNAIIYVEETRVVDKTKKKQYLNILKAQLSDEALALLMYDAMSDFGQNKEGFNEFYDVLDCSNFFENIQETVLLERCHYRFYPHTSFRFLNADELRNVINVN